MRYLKLAFGTLFLLFGLQSCVYSDYIFQKQNLWVTEW